MPPIRSEARLCVCAPVSFPYGNRAAMLRKVSPILLPPRGRGTPLSGLRFSGCSLGWFFEPSVSSCSFLLPIIKSHRPPASASKPDAMPRPKEQLKVAPQNVQSINTSPERDAASPSAENTKVAVPATRPSTTFAVDPRRCCALALRIALAKSCADWNLCSFFGWSALSQISANSRGMGHLRRE